MSKKLYWGIVTLILLIIGAFVFLIVKNQAEIRQLKKESAALQMQRQQEKSEQVPQGHFHDDGTFHAGEPPDPIQQDGTPQSERHDEPKVQYTAPKGAVLKPDFPKVDPKEDPVKAAYERLEYIKNNPYAWGGVHSERATELINQLMTASGPIRLIDHAHGDEVSEQIYELCGQGDPRAAEVLIAHMCDGDTAGHPMIDALVEIGPPAVPYILPYLEKLMAGEEIMSVGMFYSLGGIGNRYRDDLGGIVDHIIIPKLEAIAADEDNERYDSASVILARSALEDIQ